MEGNRLYPQPNDWKTGDPITQDRLNNIETAILNVANEIITAADTEGSLQDKITAITNDFEKDLNKLDDTVNNRLDSLSNEFEASLAHVSIDVNDLGLEQDPETYLVYPTYKGERSEIGIPLAGGGGGGGGSSISYTPKLTNTMASRTLSVADGSTVILQFNYSSIDEEGNTDGPGTGSITVNSIARATISIPQGANSVDVTQYLSLGTNTVRIKVTNSENLSKILDYTITVIALSMTTNFNLIDSYTDQVRFVYTLTGTGEKVVHYIMDGVEIDNEIISTSGRAITYIIPKQSHGAHIFQCYAVTNDINAVSSNTLTLSMMWISSNNNAPIVASNFMQTTAVQGETITIPYRVYDPVSETTAIDLIVLAEDGSTYSSIHIENQDRATTSWSLSDYPAGNIILRIATRDVNYPVDFPIEVTEYIFPLSVTTDSLRLDFNAVGRSNNESNPASWTYTGVEGNGAYATFSGFGWSNADGWGYDSEGAPVLRFLPGDTMSIPTFYPFATDAKETGYTIEVELATKDVRDYDSIVVSCMNNVGNGIGFQIKSQEATLRTQGIPNGLSMLFKEDSHVRITFVIEPATSSRFIYIYINGIMCRAIQYSADDVIQHVISNRVGITIGAETCGLDLYRIRCYARDLNRNEELNNYICDMSNLSDKQAAYARNNILNEDTLNIALKNLPPTLPYMIVTSDRMPRSKGDKRDCTITFVDPTNSAYSFTATTVGDDKTTIDVQGTSSAGYPVKNSKIKLKNITINDEPASGIRIHSDEPAVKTLCTKVDYASSEGANNVLLVRLYDAICREQGYLTPPQKTDSTVHQGICGRPIIMFWQDAENPSAQPIFYGKANMNWDKGNPKAFGFSDGCECWEFKNNTSNHCLFKSGDMSGWAEDFEARYPEEDPNDPEEDYQDVTKLGRVMAWVASTDTTAATNETLSAPVTYENVEYTTDSAAYRLAKFKNEFTDWFYKDLAIFYYIFTQTFLMVDSRAKNMFITNFGEGDKWVASIPYDMDTALGINNEGELVFEYNLEDTDIVSGSKVFNGQDSVLWNNVREVFAADIKAMYTNLRSNSRYFNYEYIKNMFEEHQSVWPERLWNEDAATKYLDYASNLGMLQGSKESQRDWWLFNAFRYWDSKYETGDAKTNAITLRIYASGSISLTPYSHIYAHTRFGSYDVRQRATRNQEITMVCPFDPSEQANDTETYIYSADRIARLGDLSPLQVGYADFEKAVKLQTLKLGDSDSGYENQQLKTLMVGNNELLTSVNIQHCTALTQTVDLSGCPGIEEVYAGGSSIAGVSLPNGGHLATLELPNTVTNLTILNQKSLANFTLEGSDSIQTLRIENTPGIPIESIINNADNLSYVRLVGVEWTATNEAALQATINKLNTCGGQDADGHNISKAVISGRVNISSISDSLLEYIQTNYTDLIIVKNGQPQYIVTYYNFDNTILARRVVSEGAAAPDVVANGSISLPEQPDTADGQSYVFLRWDNLPTAVHSNVSVNAIYGIKCRIRFRNSNAAQTLLQEIKIDKGQDAVYSGSTPTRSDAQYYYTFTGWDQPLTNVQRSMDVFAQYSTELKYYTVYWCNRGDSNTNPYYPALETDEHIGYGMTTTYDSTTPIHKDNPDVYEFSRWLQQVGSSTVGYFTDNTTLPITGETKCIAQYKDIRSPVITYLERTLEEFVDDTIDTIRSYAFYNNSMINRVETAATTIGAYAFRNCDNLESINISNAITIGSNAFYKDNKITSAPLILNATTINSEAFRSCAGLTKVSLNNENKITIGSQAFYNCDGLTECIINSNEIPTLVDSNALPFVFKNYKSNIIYVPDSLVNDYKQAANWSVFANHIVGISQYPTVLNFETTQDTWAEIIASSENGTYQTKYEIGTIKKFIDSDGNEFYMQLVAKDADELTDGSGYAHMTWLGATTHGYTAYMFSNSDTYDEYNWENSYARAYLADRILPILVDVKDAIKPVNKTYSKYDGTTATCSDTLWLPSFRELGVGSTIAPSSSWWNIRENAGVSYTNIFTNNESRIRYSVYKNVPHGDAMSYYTRSQMSYVNSSTNYERRLGCISATGTTNISTSGSAEYSLVLGFCI